MTKMLLLPGSAQEVLHHSFTAVSPTHPVVPQPAWRTSTSSAQSPFNTHNPQTRAPACLLHQSTALPQGGSLPKAGAPGCQEDHHTAEGSLEEGLNPSKSATTGFKGSRTPVLNHCHVSGPLHCSLPPSSSPGKPHVQGTPPGERGGKDRTWAGS